MKTKIVNTGDYVLYKKLDGALTLYKVLSMEQDFDDIDILIGIVDYKGGIGNKKFTTTLKNKKGDQRIFRYWLQIGDSVINKDTKEKGRVTSFFTDSTSTLNKKDEVCSNMVEVTSSKNLQFIYTLEQAATNLDLIDSDELE